MKIYTLTWFSSNSSSVLGVYSTFDIAEQTMHTLLDKDEVLDSENAYSYGGTTRYPILRPNNVTEYFEIRLFYLDDEEEDWDEDDDEDDEEEDEDWDDDWDENDDEDENDDDWDDEDEDSDTLAILQELLKHGGDVKVELEIVIEGE